MMTSEATAHPISFYTFHVLFLRQQTEYQGDFAMARAVCMLLVLAANRARYTTVSWAVKHAEIF